MAVRYPMMTANLWLNPFFMIAPYIMLSESYGMSSHILETMLLWSWMCQFIFGISNSINDLKMEGTFVNILMSPCSFLQYQFMYFIYLVIDNAIMTAVTLLLCRLILNVTVSSLLSFICLLAVTSAALFCFSVGYTVLVLRFKKIAGINSFIQQVLGVLSGYTYSVKYYPVAVRFLSYCIPLTYAIVISEQNYQFSFSFAAVWAVIAAVYLIIGSKMTEHGIIEMKRRGDIEQW